MTAALAAALVEAAAPGRAGPGERISVIEVAVVLDVFGHGLGRQRGCATINGEQQRYLPHTPRSPSARRTLECHRKVSRGEQAISPTETPAPK
jgi:hypothetical protein